MFHRAVKAGASCLILILALAAAAGAQEAAPLSSHEQAAHDLIRLLGGAKLAESGAEAMMGIVRQNPELAPYEDVFRAWYKKVFAAGDLESEVAKLYVDAFSESELRELEAFYKTPIGQKALATLPELMKKGAELGMRRGQEHAGELQEMLEKAKAEREKQKGSGP
jgi:hypothetical protein